MTPAAVFLPNAIFPVISVEILKRPAVFVQILKRAGCIFRPEQEESCLAPAANDAGHQQHAEASAAAVRNATIWGQGRWFDSLEYRRKTEDRRGC